MKNFKWVMLSTMLVAPCMMLALTTTGVQAQTATPQKKQAPKPVPSNNGERVFLQNCSRCHNAPDGFSPRIAGSVVRHMRVRANLSEKDAQDVLRFFNP